ncbi:hypothetical protein HDU96_010683 [Phlyctochytrium bullatum]|nr:hypothetical protein HDU96_010683 [Phlyctochytrium bullatum]
MSSDCEVIARALGPGWTIPTADAAACCGLGLNDRETYPPIKISCTTTGTPRVLEIELRSPPNKAVATGFTFPVALSTLPALYSLGIYDEVLKGTTIPADAFATGWPMLMELSLTGSLVGGTYPSSLTALKQLRSLHLDNNGELDGRWPDDPAAYWPMLQSLSTLGTKISATLNDNWSKLTDLRTLFIGNRQTSYVDGSLEPFTRLSNLISLWVLRGNFNSPLPQSLISNNPNLRDLQLPNGNFYGPIPESYANLKQSCDLQGNFLSGSIAQSFYATGCRIGLNCFERTQVEDELWPVQNLFNKFQRTAAECQERFQSPGALSSSVASIILSTSASRATVTTSASSTTSTTVATAGPNPSTSTSSRVVSTSTTDLLTLPETSLAPSGSSGTTVAAAGSQDGTSSAFKLSTGAIIGIGVGGGVLLLAVVILSVILCRRRKRNEPYATGDFYDTYYQPQTTKLYQAAPIYQPPSASIPQYAVAPTYLAQPGHPKSEPLPPEPASSGGVFAPREPIPPSSMRSSYQQADVMDPLTPNDCSTLKALFPTLGIVDSAPAICCNQNITGSVVPSVDSKYSITCRDNRLVALDINGQNLNAQLTSNLASLTALEFLRLVDCNLRGVIPAAVGSMISLKYLLTGIIPSELGSLTNLVYLDVSGNCFEQVENARNYARTDMKIASSCLAFYGLPAVSTTVPISPVTTSTTRVNSLVGPLATSTAFGSLPVSVIASPVNTANNGTGSGIAEAPNNNSASGLPILPIALGVSLGAVVVIAVIVVGLLLWRRRQNDLQREQHDHNHQRKPILHPPPHYSDQLNFSEIQHPLTRSSGPRSMVEQPIEFTGRTLSPTTSSYVHTERASSVPQLSEPVNEKAGQLFSSASMSSGSSFSRDIPARGSSIAKPPIALQRTAPPHVLAMSPAQVSELLMKMGVGPALASALEDSGIDGKSLATVTDYDLQRMGLEQPISRHMVLQVIEHILSGAVAPNVAFRSSASGLSERTRFTLAGARKTGSDELPQYTS